MEFPTYADMDQAKKDYLVRLEGKREKEEEEEARNPKHRKPNPEDEFKTYKLNLPANAFPHLFPIVTLEPIGKGQQGAIVLYPDPEQGAPIVRSTIKLTKPAQTFQPLHHQLANEIRQVAELPLPLNNCLVQVFDNTCKDMEFESMQAQDLAFCEESHMAVFSCYKDPSVASRKLVVESKTPGKGRPFEISLEPNSVVVWSLESNSHFRHKIVLDESKGTPAENEWMGLTFRTSSTCIQYKQKEGDTQPRAYFTNGMPLILLEGDRACSTTHRLRELELERTDFVYPSCMMSTISPGDLLAPVEMTKQEEMQQ